MIGWVLGLPWYGTTVVVLLAVLLGLVIAVYVDVYLVRSSDLVLPKQGLAWIDHEAKYQEVPPTPSGRDLRVEFGYWIFLLPTTQGYVGWHDRVCCAAGKRPNAETLCHEYYHAALQSREHGLWYLPWYLLHGKKKTEGSADAFMHAHHKERFYQQAAAYLYWNRTNGGIQGTPL